MADLDGLSPVLSAVLLLWNSEQLLKPSYSMDLPVPRGTSMHLLANLIIIIYFLFLILYGVFCSKYANVCFNRSPQGECVTEMQKCSSSCCRNDNVLRGTFHWHRLKERL